MSTPKHTPPPWHAQYCYDDCENDEEEFVIVTHDADGGDHLIGFAVDEHFDIETTAANAALMAAAPDLLAACKRALELSSVGLMTDRDERTVVAMCRAAIAKATTLPVIEETDEQDDDEPEGQ